MSDGRGHDKVSVAVRPAAGADAAVEHGMDEKLLVEFQTLLDGYQVALAKATNEVQEHNAQKAIRKLEGKIRLVKAGLWPEEVDPETDEDEGAGWDDHLDGPSPSFVIDHSDPSIEWTASDFE